MGELVYHSCNVVAAPEYGGCKYRPFVEQRPHSECNEHGTVRTRVAADDSVQPTAGARPMIRSETKIISSVVVTYPTGIVVDVSVKLPKSVSYFLLSGFRISGRAPVDEFENVCH
jgi:hypothetical protein